MPFLRLFGLLLSVTGFVLLLIGIIGGSAAVRDVPLTYMLFAILAGLLIAVGANAGERMSQKQKGRQDKQKKDSANG